MKTFFFFIVILTLSSISFSQGNLQFNQVKLVGDSPQTVPTGKVWKIESAPLTVKNGIRVPPTFIMGTDTIVMGYDSYTTSELENVVSVKLEWKGTNSYGNGSCGTCHPTWSSNGSNNVIVNVNGVGNSSDVINQNLTFSNIPNSAQSSFTSLGNLNPNYSGNNKITSWNVYFTPLSTQPCLPSSTQSGYGYNYNFRVSFILANGNTLVYELAKAYTMCGGAPQQSIVGNTVGTETRSRPQVTTQFPIWLPSGTAVRTLTNISKLSVLEFNVVQ